MTAPIRRRRFLSIAAVSAAAAAMRPLLAGSSGAGKASHGSFDLPAGPGAVAPRRLLVLGGTGAVGRFVVEAARAAGHRVTLANRGHTDAAAFADLERLALDRSSLDVDRLRARLGARRFDAVLDTWWGAPEAVATAARALADRVDRYVFVSDVAVGAPGRTLGPLRGPADSSRVARLAAAEAAGGAALGRRFVALRAADIALPSVLRPDHPLVQWARRCARGGVVRVEVPRTARVPVTDPGLLARFAVEVASADFRDGVPWPFDVYLPVSTEEWLHACKAVSAAPVELSWTSEGARVDLDVDAEDVRAESPGLARARAAGLEPGPLAHTVRRLASA